MIIDFNNTTESELLAYINDCETKPGFIADEEDMSHYHDALEVLYEILKQQDIISPFREGIFNRLLYFEMCYNPSIENLKLFLKSYQFVCL